MPIGIVKITKVKFLIIVSTSITFTKFYFVKKNITYQIRFIPHALVVNIMVTVDKYHFEKSLFRNNKPIEWMNRPKITLFQNFWSQPWSFKYCLNMLNEIQAVDCIIIMFYIVAPFWFVLNPSRPYYEKTQRNAK